MKFERVELDNTNEDNLVNWQSANGQWQIHLNLMLFGFSAQVRHMDMPSIYRGTFYVENDSVLWGRLVANVMLGIFDQFTEDIDVIEVERLLARDTTTPLDEHPEDWARFCNLAKMPYLSELSQEVEAVDDGSMIVTPISHDDMATMVSNRRNMQRIR